MKKFGCFLLVGLLVFGFIGCSGTKDNKVTTSNSNGTDTDTKVVDSLSPTATAEVTETATEITVTEAVKPTEAIAEGSVTEVKIDSEAIAKNVIGDIATRSIYVYLPPSYNSSDKKYPVVYFLHGYQDSAQVFANGKKADLDQEFNKGAKEFIMVILDGNNKTGGSFYVNSPASGNWEDFIVSEVVGYMDSNYRTIADRDSRGISGYSMGGFGALNLSLLHPEVFSSTLVFCPGVFAEKDLDAVLRSWSGSMDIQRSYAQAFSPDVNNTKDFGNIILKSDIEAKNTVWDNWMNGFSGWNKKLEDYLALKQPLKGVMINYSLGDSYQWIPEGCKCLMGLMDEKKIKYTTETFTGGHIVPSSGIKDYFVPFFNEKLTY